MFTNENLFELFKILIQSAVIPFLAWALNSLYVYFKNEDKEIQKKMLFNVYLPLKEIINTKPNYLSVKDKTEQKKLKEKFIENRYRHLNNMYLFLQNPYIDLYVDPHLYITLMNCVPYKPNTHIVLKTVFIIFRGINYYFFKRYVNSTINKLRRKLGYPTKSYKCKLSKISACCWYFITCVLASESITSFMPMEFLLILSLIWIVCFITASYTISYLFE